MQNLSEIAKKNVTDTVRLALEHGEDDAALIVYDDRSELARILTDAYRSALPKARFVDFDSVSKEEIIASFDAMQKDDLVVLIQSSNFLLDAFRIRLHLFQRGLKVIEHMHLYRNSKAVWDVYVNALAYDPEWYRAIGPRLKEILMHTTILRIESGDASLVIEGGLEEPKLNIGDYSGMENVGGTFPIGEVFTEARDFARMSGSFMIYAFAGDDFTVSMHEPFRVEIDHGEIIGIADDAPQEFKKIVEMVKKDERALIREIGFGLNRAITKERYLEDITAFERILGMHLSLGEKHGVYKKPGIQTHRSRYHIDLFPWVERVFADDLLIFEKGTYLP